ncbi:MAG: transcriptional regulator [Frankiaceae bacterium]|jgi:transcriptional regulator with XRE-family HTH domain|nr:transcriptional regulator [Frankiaceae bacterium]
MTADNGAGEVPVDRAYARELGARLRAIRSQQGLSLQAVERRSDGKWKAVVVGSYERGDRSISVSRLAELADFYAVPITELLPGRPATAARTQRHGRIVLDLAALNALDGDEVAPLRRFVTMIQAARDDFSNKLMSLRAEDLRALAIIYNMPLDEFFAQLLEWELLIRTGQ